jgi:FMN phosphatase YigB (HAD superfamily)
MNISTVLVDLDNTLLGNSMEEFLPAYFSLLEPRLATVISGHNVRQTVSESVQTAIKQQTTTKTLFTSFITDLSRRIGVPVDTLISIFSLFYEVDFPKLQSVTRRSRSARKIIAILIETGCQIVIATNPLFPETAIRQRLAWAGVNGFPFALVTTMENSHFCKPDLRYYRDILQQTGSKPETSLMVGNDLNMDMAPAQRLGLNTWWVTDHVRPLPHQRPAVCDYQGTLFELADWLVSALN